ncbi:MAG: xylose isomerase [Caldisericota bacterium]|nr:xylose isomerase [Caldisericota bacterium]
MVFNNIGTIGYEGSNSKNPLAFKYYKADEVVLGRTMEDWTRVACAYWHTLGADGTDMFGWGTMQRPWTTISDPMEKARVKVDALFEFCEKLGIRFFCFHDRDIAPEGDTLRETNQNLDTIVGLIEDHMKTSPVRLLWGTANMTGHPRFVHGVATSCNADVFAYAAAQVKHLLEVSKRLGGLNYVFWGGREGYETLLNTDYMLEQDNRARFFHMAVDYAKDIGYTGQFLIEPKAFEPSKHQYDFDAANALAFLRGYDLEPFFKFNIEANHATLAGHTFQHELRYCRIIGKLGSIDANQGDPLLGWDTDQMPTDAYACTLAMLEVIKNGGLQPGGLNFDAKVRRASFELDDLFIGHIAGMDAFALGLRAAAKLIESGGLDGFVEQRYASYASGIGKDIVDGKADFRSLEAYILDKQPAPSHSGRQEYLETLVTQAIADCLH